VHRPPHHVVNGQVALADSQLDRNHPLIAPGQMFARTLRKLIGQCRDIAMVHAWKP
jgi:hypothetical protein